jgi:hypothetical protein
MIQWLIDQVTSIWSTFTGYIQSIFNMISDLWRGVQTWALWAKNEAISWAVREIQSVISLVISARDWLLQQIYYTWNDAKSYATNLVAQSLANLSGLIANVSNVISAYLQPVFAWVQQNVNNLIVYVNSLIAPLVGVFNYVSSRIAIFEAIIQNIPNWSINALVALIQTYTNPILQKLAIFTDNPLDYILSVVSGRIIELVSSAIAWGLGTVKYDLPDPPSWYQKQKRS